MAFTDNEIKQILDAFLDMTTERQYIGARYVPIFGRKDEDSILWDNTAPYEPLTIVLYQGNSYTSRQYVPIGVDINNEEFWAITGNYNAQIEQYRQETLHYVEITEDLNETVNFMIANTLGYQEGNAEKYIWHIIKFSKDEFIVNMALNNPNDPDVPIELIDYARENHPFFCANVTNSEHFVYNGVLYHGDYTPPASRGAFYAKESLSDEDFTIIRTDGTESYASLLNDGYNYITGAWQPIVMNNQSVDIADYATFNEYNPMHLFAWDNDWYYFAILEGRLFNKPGVTAVMCRNFAIANHWPNCVMLDGGDSVREYFGKVGVQSAAPRLNRERYDRKAYVNLTVFKKGE